MLTRNQLIFLLIAIIAIVTFLVFYYPKDNLIQLNLYNQPLEKCPDSEKETAGSWDFKLKCSELTGGVHQICFKNIGKNANKFSKRTGQSDWSTQRGEQNHCVCLGAWSLYQAKKNQGNFTDTDESKLKCSAIPKIAFSKNYINKFSTWNGNEVPNQLVDGVEGIVTECEIDANGDDQKIKSLRENYCSFATDVHVLKYNELGEIKQFYKERC